MNGFPPPSPPTRFIRLIESESLHRNHILKQTKPTSKQNRITSYDRPSLIHWFIERNQLPSNEYSLSVRGQGKHPQRRHELSFIPISNWQPERVEWLHQWKMRKFRAKPDCIPNWTTLTVNTHTHTLTHTDVNINTCEKCIYVFM